MIVVSKPNLVSPSPVPASLPSCSVRSPSATPSGPCESLHSTSHSASQPGGPLAQAQRDAGGGWHHGSASALSHQLHGNDLTVTSGRDGAVWGPLAPLPTEVLLQCLEMVGFSCCPGHGWEHGHVLGMTAAQWHHTPIPQMSVAQGQPGPPGASARQAPARALGPGTMGTMAVLSGIQRWQQQGTSDASKGSH